MPVLIVDDDADARNFTRSLLEHHGYRTLEAGNAIEAYSIANLQKPRLITVDLKMDGLDGVDLIQMLRSRPETASIPLLVLSSYRSDYEGALAHFHVDAVADKPVPPSQLLGLVTTLASER